MPTGRNMKPALIVVGLVVAVFVFLLVYDKPAALPPGTGQALGLMGSGTAIVPPPKPAGPAELALVAPLKKGGKLLDYDVNTVSAVDGGVIWIILKKDEGTVYLTVALAADAGGRAPLVAGPYALFNSAFKAPAADQQRLLNALADILKANTAAPTPPGLSAYTPGPMPMEER